MMMQIDDGCDVTTVGVLREYIQHMEDDMPVISSWGAPIAMWVAEVGDTKERMLTVHEADNE